MSSGASTVRACPFTFSLNFKWRPSAENPIPALSQVFPSGKPVQGAEELLTAIGELKAGDTLELTIERDGKTVTVKVTLETPPSAGAGP